jgi:serine protease Do
MTLQWLSKMRVSRHRPKWPPLASLFRGLLCFGVALLPGCSRSANVFDAIGEEVNSIYEKSLPSIVRVRSEGPELTMAGTGFFIDDKGTVLTAAPILGDNVVASVDVNGTWLNAKILGRDTRSGVALLQIAQGMTPYLNFGNSAQLKSGLAVMAIGFPRNLPAAPTFGFVSGFDFRYLDRYFPTTHIRANVPIAPGQVGGPLLNTKGDVVGLLVTAIDEGRSVYALPIEAAAKIIADFKKNGVAKHGWVGVGVEVIADSHDGARGVKISQLFEDTPAYLSGLELGDVVTKIGARSISCPADVMDASFFSQVGQETNVTVVRDGKQLVYKFIVQERPSAMPTVAQKHRPQPAPVVVSPQPNAAPEGIQVKVTQPSQP